MGHRPAFSGLERQARVRAVERLDLALLVDRDDHRVLGRPTCQLRIFRRANCFSAGGPRERVVHHSRCFPRQRGRRGGLLAGQKQSGRASEARAWVRGRRASFQCAPAGRARSWCSLAAWSSYVQLRAPSGCRTMPTATSSDCSWRHLTRRSQRVDPHALLARSEPQLHEHRPRWPSGTATHPPVSSREGPTLECRGTSTTAGSGRSCSDRRRTLR